MIGSYFKSCVWENHERICARKFFNIPLPSMLGFVNLLAIHVTEPLVRRHFLREQSCVLQKKHDVVLGLAAWMNNISYYQYNVSHPKAAIIGHFPVHLEPFLNRTSELNAAKWPKLPVPADIFWAVHATKMKFCISEVIHAVLPAFKQRPKGSVPPIQRCPASRYEETSHYIRRTKDPTRRQALWTWADSRVECGLVTKVNDTCYFK
jgi:hypothetical protein